MSLNRLKYWLVWAALAGWSGLGSWARGGGFQIPGQAARATGQGDAMVARADDPSAIFYNPAGLTEVPGTQISAGLYTLLPDFRFESEAGDAQNNDIGYVPHFYASSDLGLKDLRFGLGVSSLFGFGEDWGEHSVLRGEVTSADLAVVNFSPAIAWRINEHLSVGGAANIYYGDLDLKSRLAFPPGSEGDFHTEGDDWALGGTVGILWRINDRHSLGLVYRSPFTLDFDGEAKLESQGLRIGPSDARVSADFPQVIVVGYAFRPTSRLALEVDVQWTDWETLDAVDIKSRDPGLDALPPLHFDYDSSFTYRFGTEYQLDRHWTVRGGYIFSETSSPERTFTPIVVDLDSHVFTLGLGYSSRKWAIDAAYHFILGADRDVDESINSPPGEYSNEAHAVTITMTFKL